MTHTLTPHRLSRRLLLAAAVLPFTPLAAQDTAPSVQAPPVAIESPTPAPAPAPSATPVQPVLRNGIPVGGTATAEPAPAEEAATAEEPAARPARTARRAAERPRARARAATPAPAPAAEPAPAPAADPVPTTLEAQAAEPPVAPPPTLPEAAAPEAAPAETAAPAEDRIGLAETWPLLGAGLLAIGGLAMLLVSRRRRRREQAEMEQADYSEAPVYHETPATAEPTMAPAAAVAAPLAHANDEHHAAAVAPMAGVAAVAADGRPWLDLVMRPVRAGVGDEDARVEFELTVANQGSAPARDVRVSTFMLAGGSSDMEQSLIDQPAQPQIAEPELDPGDGRSIDTAVALPRAGLGDAVLPVVVADARYRLPDGSEGRTSARFAVGVPMDGDLAHFDVESPSGLHEGVEARLQGELERV